MTNGKELTRVKVVVRVRPVTGLEMKQKLTIVENADHRSLEFKGQNYSFDSVLGLDKTQRDLFDEAAPMLKSFTEGFNSTIMAYGQTGSGKTYTMGTEMVALSRTDSSNNQGLIPRFVNDLFDSLNSRNGDEKSCFKIKASFLEVYGDIVYDLIDSAAPTGSSKPLSTSNRVPLAVREDDGRVFVQGLNDIELRSAEDTLEILRNGVHNRITGSTQKNPRSSRSHAIFTLTLEQSRQQSNPLDEPHVKTSKLTFVDLAGSERMGEAKGQRMKQGVQINTGLFHLGQVINCLADEQKVKSNAKVFVPYRNSTLTRLLEDALGGNSQTLFLACVSPAECNESESQSTLMYASQVRNIKNKPVMNVNNVDQTQMGQQSRWKCEANEGVDALGFGQHVWRRCWHTSHGPTLFATQRHCWAQFRRYRSAEPSRRCGVYCRDQLCHRQAGRWLPTPCKVPLSKSTVTGSYLRTPAKIKTNQFNCTPHSKLANSNRTPLRALPASVVAPRVPLQSEYTILPAASSMVLFTVSQDIVPSACEEECTHEDILQTEEINEKVSTNCEVFVQHNSENTAPNNQMVLDSLPDIEIAKTKEQEEIGFNISDDCLDEEGDEKYFEVYSVGEMDETFYPPSEEVEDIKKVAADSNMLVCEMSECDDSEITAKKRVRNNTKSNSITCNRNNSRSLYESSLGESDVDSVNVPSFGSRSSHPDNASDNNNNSGNSSDSDESDRPAAKKAKKTHVSTTAAAKKSVKNATFEGNNAASAEPLDGVEKMVFEGKILSNHTAKELKDFLRAKGLSVSGKKVQLIHRLATHMLAQPPTVDSAATTVHEEMSVTLSGVSEDSDARVSNSIKSNKQKNTRLSESNSYSKGIADGATDDYNDSGSSKNVHNLIGRILRDVYVSSYKKKRSKKHVDKEVGGRNVAYGKAIDNVLLARVKEYIANFYCVDENSLRTLLEDVLQKEGESDLLEKYVFDKNWADRFIVRHKLDILDVFLQTPLPEDFDTLLANYVDTLTLAIKVHRVPQSLVLSMSEIELNFVPGAVKDRFKKEAALISICGMAKRNVVITVTTVAAADGTVLRPQLIFVGSKDTTAHPKTEPPFGGYYTHNPHNHAQSVTTMLELVDKVLLPYKQAMIRKYKLPKDQHMIVKLTDSPVHTDDKVMEKLKECHIVPVFVPESCKDALLEVYIACAKVLNFEAKKAFKYHLCDTFTQHQQEGGDVEDFCLDLTMSSNKPHISSFVERGYEALTTQAMRETIKKTFAEQGRVVLADDLSA